MEFGPIAPLMGTLFGTLTGGAVTLFVFYKRKKVTFWVRQRKDITKHLLPHIEVSVEGKKLIQLNQLDITVRNTGNTTLKEFLFEVRLPGPHGVCVGKADSSNPLLNRDVVVETTSSTTVEVISKISVPYLNPREMFDVILFYDGAAVRSEIRCRMEEASTKIRQGVYIPPLEPFKRLPWALVTGFLAMAFSIVSLGYALAKFFKSL